MKWPWVSRAKYEALLRSEDRIKEDTPSLHRALYALRFHLTAQQRVSVVVFLLAELGLSDAEFIRLQGARNLMQEYKPLDPATNSGFESLYQDWDDMEHERDAEGRVIWRLKPPTAGDSHAERNL